MNALEIQKRRKELGLNQTQLAKKLGVSVKTISNYENGEVIPLSKKALLLQILSDNAQNESSDLNKIDNVNYTGFDEKTNQIKERISQHEEICFLLKDDPVGLKHQKEVIRLLKFQVELIQKAKKDKLSD